MRFKQVYSVQVMLGPELKPYAHLLASYLRSYADDNEPKSRKIYVETEDEPSEKRKKDAFLALRSWLREVIPDTETKAIWAPRWQITMLSRRRTVFGGLSADGTPYASQATSDVSGIELADLQAELADIYR